MAELLSGRFNDLLERPVHAEMLCQIALEPKALDTAMTVSQLYDTFVHYLLQREVEKPARHSSFAIEVRRTFNASLAWWLWERGGASTTTLNDIPQSLCDDAAKDIEHRMAREELRRELIQGCLVEKGGSTIYFGHRSLQEFLVAEHLIETDLLQSLGEKPSWFARLSAAVTPEITAFILGSLKISPERAARASAWFQALGLARVDEVSQVTLELFANLWRQYRPSAGRQPGSVWHMWLEYCLQTERSDFLYRFPGTIVPLRKLFAWADEGNSRETQAAAMMVAARNLLTETSDQGRTSVPIAAALPIDAFGAAVRAAQSEKSGRQTVRREENYRLWSILRSWNVVQQEGDDVRIEINALKLLEDAEEGLMCTFAREGLVFNGPALSITPQQLYQAFSTIDTGFDDKKLDAIRPYFNNPDVRRRISPLVVEHKKSRPA